jgi:hypothetical protein
MTQNERDLLEMLKFELRFLECGGYEHSARTPWRTPSTFEDSPICLNFNDLTHPHPCSECLLMQFVPEERRTENLPCWFIPLTAIGETVNYFVHCGTKFELEEALAAWLRRTINSIEDKHAGKQERSAQGEPDGAGGTAKT